MIRTTTCLGVLASIGMGVSAIPALGNHIDYVTDGGFPMLVARDGVPTATNTSVGAPGNILGSEREVRLDYAGLPGGAIAASTSPTIVGGPGAVGPDLSEFILLQNSGGASGTFTLTYDGTGNAGLGGLDFDTNWDAIQVSFFDVQGMGDLTVIVRDTSNAVGSSTQPISTSLAASYQFLFTDPGYAAVDFTEVDSVVVRITTTQRGSDFDLSAITREVIPEPASLGLFALGGLALRRRR